ncbi:hypothetical protein CNMCM8927_003584 [Aspergillus lentulus]|uniref:Protein kinase domain-containing protein n=1 Tax=Aspergillus lentulus TaxID=293939 RepID=A0AAN5YSC2_ASPLE|nr:hypothetical protein CNMCM8927_003584 [Aspergillus lentulus]
MVVTSKLGSPLELPVRGVPRHMTLPQTIDIQSDFVKSGSPYDQLNRFFVGLSPTWGPVSAIEFSEGSNLAYVYQERIEERDLQAGDFKETSHPNLVNLKEVFIAKQNVFFLYDTWGISLEEIQQSSSKFCLGEVEIATISKGILQALKYVHEVLGICHGNVTLSTVLINQEGVVKLADVGSSLIREPRRQQKSKDLQAVCSIARSLLRLDETSAIRGTMGLLAEDFTGSSGRATAADLLKISILSYALAWDRGVCVHMGHTQPFDDFERNLPEAESASVIETRYVRMLLELDYIPWFYNTSASAAHWALLAGYLVVPGTFTSLQKSDFLTEGLETNRTGKAILSTIQNPPLLAIACFLMVLGSVMISWLTWERKENYIWLINRLFIPVLLNAIAGLLTTFVNVYTAQNGEWSIMAVLTVVVTGVSTAVSLSLTIIYKFGKLERVKREHEMEIKAGFHVISHKASHPPTGKVGRGDLEKNSG